MMFLWSTIIATLVGLVSAAVIPRESGFKTLSQGQIDSTDVYAHYAAAAMCSPDSLTYWSCGTHCTSTSNFVVSATGGSGTTFDPQWYTGYDNKLDSIIVSFQGGDGETFFTHLANADQADTEPLNPFLFPNMTDEIQVYQGFNFAQNSSAMYMLPALSNLMSQYSESSITVIGYSVGAVVALLDGLLIRMTVDPNIDVKVVLYGLPRVGNEPFASFADSVLAQNVKHISNKNDPMPVVPAISLGFTGISGEIHISENGKWTQCPGEDNGDPRCAVGTVTSLNDANFSDHFGPYNGIMMQCTGSG